MSARIDQLDANTVSVRSRWIKVDAERLTAFLAAQPTVASVGSLSLNYPSEGAGVSNGIALIDAMIDEGAGPQPRRLVLRYSPGPTLLKQKSFRDEFLTLCALQDSGIAAPRPLWLDEDGQHLGVRGFVMERVEGEAPSAGILTKGLLADVTPERRHAMMLEAAAFHGRLKAAGIGAERVPHLVERGVGATPLEREVGWWLREAELSAPGDSRLDRLQGVAGWLVDRQPRVRPATLVHGDSQFANLMFRDDKVVAALDWELAYLGHGEADLALLIHMAKAAAAAMPEVAGVPTPAEFLAQFEHASGAPVEALDFFTVFLLFKMLSVLMASAATMPRFSDYWEANWDELEGVRRRGRQDV